MPAAVGIVQLIVSAASAAYSAYSQNDNAIDQEKALDKQKKQQEAAAAAEAEKIRENNLRLQGAQRAALGSAGVDLTGGGTADVITSETNNLTGRDLNTLGLNLSNQLSSIDSQKAMIPGLGQIIGSNALNFGSNLLNSYSNKIKQDAAGNLLDQKYGTTTSNNMFTGTSSNKNTLLGR